MEEQYRKRGKIGKMALIIGMLVIGFALGSMVSHGGMRGGWGDGQRGPAGWQQMPQAPQAQQAPQAPNVGPGQDQGQGGFQNGPGMGRGFQDGRGMMQGDMMQGGMGRGGMHQRGPGGFIFGIFGLIGGLIKMVFMGLALYLLFIVARDRWGKKHDGKNDGPGSDHTPNTGMTTSL